MSTLSAAFHVIPCPSPTRSPAMDLPWFPTHARTQGSTLLLLWVGAMFRVRAGVWRPLVHVHLRRSRLLRGMGAVPQAVGWAGPVAVWEGEGEGEEGAPPSPCLK